MNLTKKPSIQQRDGSWGYLHPFNATWHGGFATRDQARTARNAVKGAEPVNGDAQFATTPGRFFSLCEQLAAEPQEPLDKSLAVEVRSEMPHPAAPTKDETMTLTLRGYSKNNKQAYYDGAANVLRFPLTSFVNGRAPQTIPVPDGVFAEPKAKVVKVKMTAEERKAARAAKPKQTIAERAQKARKRADELAAQAAAAGQPSL